MGRIVADFNIEHGGQTAKALRTDAEIIHALHDF